MGKPAVSRSVLYMPVSERRFVEGAWKRGSDAVILDLEDSVAPHLKDHARALVKKSIPLAARGGAAVLVRVNVESVREDLEASVWPGLDMIILPKTESGDQVARLADWLDELEGRRGLEQGTVGIWPLIETAVGVSHAYEIGSASPRVWWYGGGEGYDMSLDFEVDMFVGFDQFEYNRGETELTARALGRERVHCLFFSGVSGTVSDRASEVQHGRALLNAGFHIETALHPGAVEGLNEGMTPTVEQVSQARGLIERVHSHSAAATVEIEDRAFDDEQVRRARELIAWAQACDAMDNRKAAARRRTQALLNELEGDCNDE